MAAQLPMGHCVACAYPLTKGLMLPKTMGVERGYLGCLVKATVCWPLCTPCYLSCCARTRVRQVGLRGYRI